ncbi:MAG TPA: YlcI/YnfO family protein [Acidimicrobiales bacterium]|nr:YlcI/YnfO family protein [Acidimicrobiales bacterium]
MRTTVSIDDELLAAARRRASQRGETLGQVVEAALRRELARAQDVARAPRIPVFASGSGPRPGIDLTSNRALHEALDDDVDLDRRR